jgi:hypothetical protein
MSRGQSTGGKSVGLREILVTVCFLVASTTLLRHVAEYTASFPFLAVLARGAAIQGVFLFAGWVLGLQFDYRVSACISIFVSLGVVGRSPEVNGLLAVLIGAIGSFGVRVLADVISWGKMPALRRFWVSLSFTMAAALLKAFALHAPAAGIFEGTPEVAFADTAQSFWSAATVTLFGPLLPWIDANPGNPALWLLVALLLALIASALWSALRQRMGRGARAVPERRALPGEWLWYDRVALAVLLVPGTAAVYCAVLGALVLAGMHSGPETEASRPFAAAGFWLGAVFLAWGLYKGARNLRARIAGHDSTKYRPVRRMRGLAAIYERIRHSVARRQATTSCPHRPRMRWVVLTAVIMSVLGWWLSTKIPDQPDAIARQVAPETAVRLLTTDEGPLRSIAATEALDSSECTVLLLDSPGAALGDAEVVGVLIPGRHQDSTWYAVVLALMLRWQGRKCEVAKSTALLIMASPPDAASQMLYGDAEAIVAAAGRPELAGQLEATEALNSLSRDIGARLDTLHRRAQPERDFSATPATGLNHASQPSAAPLEEDFSGSLTKKWNVYGGPLPSIRKDVGNPAPCFENNGDEMYDSGAISKRSFDFSTGLTIEADFYVDGDPNGCWVSSSIGLLRDFDYSDTKSAAYSVRLASGYSGAMCNTHGEGNIGCQIITETGDTETCSVSHDDRYLRSWHHFEILIDASRHVSFLIDGVLLYKTTGRLSLAYNNMPLLLGNRSSEYGTALHDNVRVSQP